MNTWAKKAFAAFIFVVLAVAFHTLGFFVFDPIVFLAILAGGTLLSLL